MGSGSNRPFPRALRLGLEDAGSELFDLWIGRGALERTRDHAAIKKVHDRTFLLF